VDLNDLDGHVENDEPDNLDQLVDWTGPHDKNVTDDMDRHDDRDRPDDWVGLTTQTLPMTRTLSTTRTVVTKWTSLMTRTVSRSLGRLGCNVLPDCPGRQDCQDRPGRRAYLGHQARLSRSVCPSRRACLGHRACLDGLVRQTRRARKGRRTV